jgi:hypothetical protein
VGKANPLPDVDAWQKAEEAAQTAEHDCVVIYRAFQRNGGPTPPMCLFERARELRLRADALKLTLWGL